MMHYDTAYNNDDYVEEYYMQDASGNGTKITNNSVFYRDNAYKGITSDYLKSDIPSSFSITNADEALPFTTSISFANATDETKPQEVSIGKFYEIYNWSYYDSGIIATSVGGETSDEDSGLRRRTTLSMSGRSMMRMLPSRRLMMPIAR